MKFSNPGRALAFVLALAAAVFAPAAQAAEPLRLAIQATGTWAWELAIAQNYGLDKKAGLDLKITRLATTEAGKIALIGGGADIILSDWLWVARERSLGQKLLFYPHSTALGAVMVKNAADFKKPADFIGKTIGVAGGPLDKSWLMLQAWALRHGVNLKKQANIVYGAPPLLAEKLKQGQIDAALEFWTFSARLQGDGFQRAVDMAHVERELGAKGPVVVIGYVFTQDFAAHHGPVLKKFLHMMKEAQKRLAENDAAFAKIAPLTRAKNAATLAIMRANYRAGLDVRPINDDIADAAAIYKVLAKVGGPQLVGSAKELDPNVFYRGDSAPPATAK